MIHKPNEPLSQVVFIHDYLQLHFQQDVLSVFNESKIVASETALTRGEPGFCDLLVGLIGKRAVELAFGYDGCAVILKFEDGTQFAVLSGESAARGPEAFTLDAPNLPTIVEQN